jgi:hypothetical protein
MKNQIKFAGSIAALATASAVQAEVKINEYLSVSGYAVAAATYTDPENNPDLGTQFDSGKGNYDSVKVAFSGAYNDITGKVSLYYVPEAADESGILDAFLSYTAGAVTLTGGKYLSYLGYEAFDPVNMTTISYGNSWNPIPAYHTGGKIDFAGEGFTLGLSVSDSLYTDADHFIGGDGDFGNGLGYEIVGTFTGIEKVTIFAGVGIEDPDGASQQYVYDLWASYAATDKLTLAGEYSYADNAFGTQTTTDYWAGFATYAFSDKVAATTRVSGTIADESGLQFTVAPTYTLNENFSVRAELTYSDSDQSSVQVASKGMFYAVQGLFKF